jgi:hypothetical protein
MDEVHVCIITNITNSNVLDGILSRAPAQSSRFKIEIYNRDCETLPSPWLLTWVHKKLMFERFNDASYSHFMCIEDDLEVTPLNVNYWLRGREALRSYNLYPSFIRVEWDNTKLAWAMADSEAGDQISVRASPLVENAGFSSYINLKRHYQGMFLYDRDLMQEHLQSKSFYFERFVPDWERRLKVSPIWPGGITELALEGLTYCNVPNGFLSRNVVPFYRKYLMIDPCCFVHHLPDKYANMPEVVLGKVLVNDILTE